MNQQTNKLVGLYESIQSGHLVYHMSYHNFPIEQIRPFTHFGTLAQAKDIINTHKAENRHHDQPYYLYAYQLKADAKFFEVGDKDATLFYKDSWESYMISAIVGDEDHEEAFRDKLAQLVSKHKHNNIFNKVYPVIKQNKGKWDEDSPFAQALSKEVWDSAQSHPQKNDRNVLYKLLSGLDDAIGTAIQIITGNAYLLLFSHAGNELHDLDDMGFKEKQKFCWDFIQKDLGYSGVKYDNAIEGAGISYIVFNPADTLLPVSKQKI